MITALVLTEIAGIVGCLVALTMRYRPYLTDMLVVLSATLVAVPIGTGVALALS